MQRKTVLLFGLILITAALLTACGGKAASTQAAVQPTDIPPTESALAAAPTEAVVAVTEQSAAPGIISFANDIKPILESHCFQCHSGSQGRAGLDVTTYESLMTGSQNGPVIVPSDAGNSLLVDLVTKGRMPKMGPKLTPEQVQLITDWINAGAQNN